MVKATVIREFNSHFTNTQPQNQEPVCVFARATSGIGAATLTSITSILRNPTLYILGRSVSRFAIQQEKLHSLNLDAKIVFLEVDVSLLSDVDKACERIQRDEWKVDYLYMSAGLVPLNGAEYTKEGLEICFALSYYTRIRLISNLLPLLSQSQNPRVLSVLNGGNEKPLIENDLALEINNGKNWSPLTVLAFEYLANNHKEMTFIHAFPGWVQTDIFARLTPPESSGVFWRMALATIRNVVKVIRNIFGVSAEESGERQAYHLTCGDFGPGHVWRIDNKSEVIRRDRFLGRYWEGAWAERVWEFTARVFEKVIR